jgi:hypothetical protein
MRHGAAPEEVSDRATRVFPTPGDLQRVVTPATHLYPAPHSAVWFVPREWLCFHEKWSYSPTNPGSG